MEKENKGINVMNKLMGVLVLASSSVYLAYIVKNMYDKVNGMSLLIGALILELFSLLFFLTSLVKNKVKNALNIFSSLAFISFITFTVLDYNSKGKSYNIACELESVNFLLERILKEYGTETK